MAPGSAWYLELHALCAAIVDLACTLTARRSAYGVRFFTALSRGAFGNSPERVEQLLKWLKKTFVLDEKLALALLQGYQRLSERLAPREVDRYIEEGLSCHEVNRRMAERFLALDLDNSEAVIQTLACECRLRDVMTTLERLLLALSGYKITIKSLSALPAASLRRRPRMVMLQRSLYLPGRINRFASKKDNRRWYVLLAVVGAAMLAFKSFPCLHGLPDYPGAKTLAGDAISEQNLFQILEFLRVLEASQTHWSGCSSLIRFAVQKEAQQTHSGRSGPEQLFFDLLSLDRQEMSWLMPLKRIVERSTHLFDTVEQLAGLDKKHLFQRYPDLNETLLRPFSFLPDFFYPGYLQPSSSEDDLLKMNASLPQQDLSFRQKARYDSVPAQPGIIERQQRSEKRNEEQGRCYLHDEWSHNRYLRGHCYVYESKAEWRQDVFVGKTLIQEGNKLRKVFEMLRPDENHKEKRLPEGDAINESLLVEYMIQARQEPGPKIDFFERPAVRRRDIAVLLLLDVSGSTGERVHDARTIDIEKDAAVIFGHGLAALGDRFSMCGFSSDGRERCNFLFYKTFDEPWDHDSQARVLAAHPMQNTRMGAALRHAGYRISQVPARQKLIILFSDGQPLDREYDPRTRYAQHDVLMACLENSRLGIVTFPLLKTAVRIWS